MYLHTSKQVVESKACPGVSFTIRRISYGRRNAITQELGHDESNPVILVRALMAAMLVDVSGLEIDGKPASIDAIDEFLDRAPEPLIEEIAACLLDEIRLSADAEKNSEPPSGTSPAATEGGSIAANASDTSCGAAATAAASIPAP